MAAGRRQPTCPDPAAAEALATATVHMRSEHRILSIALALFVSRQHRSHAAYHQFFFFEIQNRVFFFKKLV